MAYWHQDESGRWYFDPTHLYPLFVIVAVVILMALKGGK